MVIVALVSIIIINIHIYIEQERSLFSLLSEKESRQECVLCIYVGVGIN